MQNSDQFDEEIKQILQQIYQLIIDMGKKQKENDFLWIQTAFMTFKDLFNEFILNQFDNHEEKMNFLKKTSFKNNIQEIKKIIDEIINPKAMGYSFISYFTSAKDNKALLKVQYSEILKIFSDKQLINNNLLKNNLMQFELAVANQQIKQLSPQSELQKEQDSIYNEDLNMVFGDAKDLYWDDFVSKFEKLLEQRNQKQIIKNYSLHFLKNLIGGDQTGKANRSKFQKFLESQNFQEVKNDPNYMNSFIGNLPNYIPVRQVCAKFIKISQKYPAKYAVGQEIMLNDEVRETIFGTDENPSYPEYGAFLHKEDEFLKLKQFQIVRNQKFDSRIFIQNLSKEVPISFQVKKNEFFQLQENFEIDLGKYHSIKIKQLAPVRPLICQHQFQNKCSHKTQSLVSENYKFEQVQNNNYLNQSFIKSNKDDDVFIEIELSTNGTTQNLKFKRSTIYFGTQQDINQQNHIVLQKTQEDDSIEEQNSYLYYNDTEGWLIKALQSEKIRILIAPADQIKYQLGNNMVVCIEEKKKYEKSTKIQFDII